MHLITLVGTLLVLMAAFSSLLAYRLGAPLLLLFLGIGLVAGVDGFGINFSNASAAYFIGSLALAVILFDSGFSTPMKTFRMASAPAIVLATAGVVVTATIFATAARLLMDLAWLEALLLGAIVASTDAAAVFFLLRVGGVNIRERVRATLEVESSINDPMAIFLTIAIAGTIMTGSGPAEIGWELPFHFVMEVGIGLAAGFAGGGMIVGLVNRLNLDRGLTPIFVLALILLVFSLAGAIGGSGFLAVYVAGLYAGNRHLRAAPTLRRFQEGMTWLAQIIMFLMLGLLATPSEFPSIVLPAIGLALFLIFVARPLAVWLCLMPFDFQRRETAFLSWVGLRGAVSIMLAIVPLLKGIEGATALFNIAFIVVLVSLVLQGWTVNALARRLGLVVPARIGPVEKVELELPGTGNHELLAYRVVANSPVVKGERIPRWARPSLVVRDGQSMRYQYAGRLRAGDYVYLFISPRYPRLLDRLFASPAPVHGDDAEFFGAFAIDPARPARDLHLAYGPDLRVDENELTIGQMMKKRLGGRAEYADRVGIGPVELIVREIDEDGEIVSIGVSLDPEETSPPTLPLFHNLTDISIALNTWMRQRRERRSSSRPANADDSGEPEAASAAERFGENADKPADA